MVAADLNLDGRINAADEPLKADEEYPGLLVGVNDGVHTNAGGELEVNCADEEINGQADYANLQRLKVSLSSAVDPETVSGQFILRCEDNASVRIFDTNGVEVIGPGVASEYQLPKAELAAGSPCWYYIEAVLAGKEVPVQVLYRAGGVETVNDEFKVSTVGMTLVDSYSIGSLNKVKAVNATVNNWPSFSFFGVVDKIGQNNPVEPVIRLRSGVELTADAYNRLWSGWYDEGNNQWDGPYAIYDRQTADIRLGSRLHI